jgi:hypothetical protein
LKPDTPLISLPAPAPLWDIADALTLKPMSADVLAALLNRLLVWKCPRNRPLVHWVFRALPLLMAHVHAPFVSRKRWEGLSPLMLQHLLVGWLNASLPFITLIANETASPVAISALVRQLGQTWNLRTLADWDMQLIAQALPIPDTLLDHQWHSIPKLNKLLALLQLQTDWLTVYPPEDWPVHYWISRFNGLHVNWAAVAKALHPSTGALQRWLTLLQGQPVWLYTQQVLVLVEGQTEERLLPLLGKPLGLVPQQWWCCPVGGKTQMLATYERAQAALTVPIVMVLDADALTVHQQLLPRLRSQDRLCLLADGELEDHLDPGLLATTLNQAYDLHPAITTAFFEGVPRVEALKTLWRKHQLGVFDKTTLASLLAQTLDTD